MGAVMARSIFESIHKAFMVKSAGGRDETGESWPDISQKTKAYHRPIRKEDLKGLTVTRERGLLSPQENKVWKGIYSSKLRTLLLHMDEDEAKKQAAKTAWATLKSLGAKTKLDILGNRTLPILIKSGRLEKSLRPGYRTKYGYRRYNQDQLFEHSATVMKVGTLVPYAKYHSKRSPLPRNPDVIMRRAFKEGVEEYHRAIAEQMRR